MAKRRKKATTKRRRVSGINKLDLAQIGLAVAGAVVAVKITAGLKKDPTKTTMVNLAPYAALVAGLGLPMVIKNPMVQKIALGLAIGGAIEALKKLAPGIVSGPYQIPVIGNSALTRRRLMNGGAMNPNQVGGYTPPRNSAYQDSLSVISGTGIA